MAPPLTPEQAAYLSSLYYDEKMKFGRDRLWMLIRTKPEGAGISRRQVRDWLSKQMVHQMFAPARVPRDIQPTVAHKPFGQVGIDLIDMTSWADAGRKWILTGIDFFTKKGYAVALKDKTQAAVVTAFNALLAQMTRPPAFVRSDNGSEFISAAFGAACTAAGVKQVLSAAGKPQSNGQVERFNGILKRQVQMNYLSTGHNTWVADLPHYLRNYNSTFQRVIKITPDAAEAGALGSDATKAAIESKITAAARGRHGRDVQRFEAGDSVRVRLEQDPNSKKSEPWSRQVYMVSRVLAPRAEHRSWQYELAEMAGRKYNADLLAVPAIERPVELPEMYIVSKLVRPATQGNVAGYVVRWRGYSPADDTFEPRTALMEDVPKVVEDFDEEHSVVWRKSKGRWAFTWEQ